MRVWRGLCIGISCEFLMGWPSFSPPLHLFELKEFRQLSTFPLIVQEMAMPMWKLP